MAKSNYESAHGATRKITAAARAAEIACARIAAKRGEGLRDRFWLDEKWRTTFLIQQRLANAILKAGYDAEAIFKALEANKWVFSLNHPRFGEFVDAQQRLIDGAISRSNQPQAATADPGVKPRAASGKMGLKQKLGGV